MPDDITASIGDIHGPLDPASKAMGRERNIPIDTHFDPQLSRAPDYFVYIFSVSKREFLVRQPPLLPHLMIPACKEHERYVLAAKLPNPFQQVDREGAVGDLMVRAHRAELVAASIVNPSNPTTSQDAVIPATQVSGIGTNLTQQGVFWTRNVVPSEDELKKAEGRRERYYRTLVERARTLEISNPKELEHEINRDYHIAAEYFGAETSWHKRMSKVESCPNCGEAVQRGVAFHKNSMGFLCIIDPVRAKAAGAPVPNED